MAYATDADLLLYVAAASAVSAPLRARVLEDTVAAIDDVAYADQTRYAHAMLAAHRLALLPGSGLTASATVASRSAGAISVSYAVPSMSSEDLSRTAYGIAFMSVRDSVPHSPEAA